MSVKVRTPFLSTFTMPGVCIGCGAPPTPGAKHKAQHSRSAGKWTATTSLEFPVCQRCAEVDRQRLVAWIPLGLAFLVGFWPTLGGLMILVGSIFALDLMMLILGLVMTAFGLGAILLGLWLVERINTWGMTAEQVQRRHVVGRSVGIPEAGQGSIVFQFEDPTYALGFSNLNQGSPA